jgi:acyl carrier protein
VGAVLGCDAEAVPLEKGFFDLGMDSLLAMDLRARLEAALDDTLPPTLTFDHPTTERLAAHLAERIGGETSVTVAALEPAAPTSAALTLPAPDQDTLSEVEGLTEEELEALIDGEVDSLLK